MAIKDDVRALKRERILEQAIALFSENGFRATSLDAIARTMDVTKPFVYGVYDKKTDILVDIYLRTVHKSLATIESAHTIEGTAIDKLSWFARTFTEVVIAERAAVAVYFQEEPSVPIEDRRRINDLKSRFDDLLASLLREGMDSRHFFIDDVRMATLAIGGMMNWIYTWYSPAGRLTSEVIAQHMADYALRIVGAAPAPSSGR
jgi:AcrR family transcriptional regulator